LGIEWNAPEIEKLLRKFNAGYCIFDLAGYQFRLHGPGGKYQGSYSQAALKCWTKRLREWDLADAYIFFDNDQDGYAVDNARELRNDCQAMIAVTGSAFSTPVRRTFRPW
jgi:uncharacterized protein YecE (DUF72 family)